jgi:DNA-binding transcriptional regulator YdaS (Cro superfamily)
VSPEAVRLWAKGQRTPRRENVAAIVRETGGEVTADDLFGINNEAA